MTPSSGSLFGCVYFGVYNHALDWCLVLRFKIKLLFSTTSVPIVDETNILDRLGNGVGGMTCEKKVITGLDSPCFRKVS